MRDLYYQAYAVILDGDEEMDCISIDEMADIQNKTVYKATSFSMFEQAKEAGEEFLKDYKAGKIDMSDFQKDAEFGAHIYSVHVVEVYYDSERDDLDFEIVDTITVDEIKEDQKMNIFEQLVIWLMRHRQVVTISTGISYNHKMIQLGRYQVVELADDMVVVEAEDFNYTARTFEDLKAVVNSIRV